MLSDLKRTAERQDVEPELLKYAAATLLTRQFLFYEKDMDRKKYRILSQHESYFSNLFDAIGFDFVFDQEFAMVGIIPQQRLTSQSLKKSEALMLLTIRLVYEEAWAEFNVINGNVHYDSERLIAKFSLATGIEERPPLTELRQILAGFRRSGLIDEIEDDNRVLTFTIRPSVRLVLNESWMEMLQQYAGVSDLEDEVLDEEEMDQIEVVDDIDEVGEEA